MIHKLHYILVYGACPNLWVHYRIPTIGIIPYSIKHLTNPQDFSILLIEGEDWGDASFLFGGIPNLIVFSGGGYWSFLENERARTFGKPAIFLEFPGVNYCREFGRDFKRINIDKSTTEIPTVINHIQKSLLSRR